MSFLDPHVGKTRGEGLHGFPDVGKGEVGPGGGVDECDAAMVGGGGDEGGDISGGVGGEGDGGAFAIEGGV